jgi:hypothetical protein
MKGLMDIEYVFPTVMKSPGHSGTTERQTGNDTPGYMTEMAVKSIR